MAALNYATEYQRSLEQAFPYSLYFGALYSTPNNGRYRWLNSKTSAKQINMMLINPLAVITPISYEFAKLDSPSALSEGKYVYYEESHEDVFVLANKKKAIRMSVEA